MHPLAETTLTELEAHKLISAVKGHLDLVLRPTVYAGVPAASVARRCAISIGVSPSP